jgi:hypothetical protein
VVKWALDLASGLLLSHITVTAAAIAVRFLVGKSDATKAFLAQAREQMTQAHAPAPAAASHAPSTADELMKLAGLHQQGILTDAEFPSAKAGLLGERNSV